MGRQAEHVYTDPSTLARFNRIAEHLQNGARVRLHLADGSHCDGVVAARPTVQAFYDGDGNEGSNGVVHLERPDAPEWRRYVWFDRIERIEHFGADAPSWS